MREWVILELFTAFLSLGLYCCYIEDRRQRREKKAIKQALRDAGYV